MWGRFLLGSVVANDDGLVEYWVSAASRSLCLNLTMVAFFFGFFARCATSTSALEPKRFFFRCTAYVREHSKTTENRRDGLLCPPAFFVPIQTLDKVREDGISSCSHGLGAWRGGTTTRDGPTSRCVPVVRDEVESYDGNNW